MDTLGTVGESLDSSELYDEIANLAFKLASEVERGVPGTSLAVQVKGQEKKAREIRETLQKSFDEYHARMRRGVELLGNAGLLKIDSQKLAALSSMIREHKGVGRGIQEELEITKESMLEMYECGANFFAAKEYGSAADVFLVLTFLNGRIPSFWIGLGMAEEMKQSFQSAGFAFLMAAEVNQEGLIWGLKSVECFLKIDQRDVASGILDRIEEEARKNPRFADILTKVQIMRESCF